MTEGDHSERYHHGDLRAALLEAAVAQVEAEGHESLSLRELAQRVGVSAAAPYRHFPDRDALLRAVAAQGYRDMAAAIRAVSEAIHTLPPAERDGAPARTFLRFAGTRQKLFLLMFATPLLAGADAAGSASSDAATTGATVNDPELAAPATAAYMGMRNRIAASCPGATDQEVAARTMAYWSTLHGFASLRAEGRLWRFMREGLSEEQMEAAVVAAAVAAIRRPLDPLSQLPDPSRSPG